jgi:hypothetical protein
MPEQCLIPLRYLGKTTHDNRQKLAPRKPVTSLQASAMHFHESFINDEYRQDIHGNARIMPYYLLFRQIGAWIWAETSAQEACDVPRTLHSTFSPTFLRCQASPRHTGQCQSYAKLRQT